jgi:hypothetical protein
MCKLFEKVLIEHDMILASPIKSFYPRTANCSKAVGAERKGLKVLTQQSPESSEDSWSPLSSDLSPIALVAQSLSSSSQSSQSSTPTQLETPRQKFIPINIVVTPVTPTKSGRGSVTHCENRFGLGYDFWRPEPTTANTSSLCVKCDERYPGYVN